MTGDTNYYDRLGISRNASQQDIRNAYFEAARCLHPDVNIEAGATELFLNIKEAYEILIDPDHRANYDGTSELKKPPPPVRLNTVYSRSSLTRIKDPQLLYVLLDLEVLNDPTASEDDSTPPLNVALVLDCSTSMQGSRLDVVKATAIELVRQLRIQDVLSIVSFNDRAEVVIPASSEHNQTRLESSIRMLGTAGGTEMFKGLETGLAEVRRCLSQSYTNHIVLITDGHTYGDEADCLELAKKAATLGIGISGLGIGSEYNDDFLDELTMQTGGNSFYISQPKDIGKLLKQTFEGLGKSYVERVNLDLRSIPGIHLRYAFRLLPEVGALGTEPPLNLGNIPRNARQRILLEFLVDPVSSDVERVLLSEGRFTFDIPKYNTSSYRIPLTLLCPVRNTPEIEPPPKIIIEAMSRLTLYRLQEKARGQASARQLDEAAQSLQNLATHLLAKGENELAKTAILEAQNLKRRQKLSNEGEKEIKYGTRALLLPTGQESVEIS
jgi:Ca-activated chloride channel family protein